MLPWASWRYDHTNRDGVYFISVWFYFDFTIKEGKNIFFLFLVFGSVVIQVLCSYVTLPLYALVTQMGSNMKPVIFSDDVALALRSWQATAKKHVNNEGRPSAIRPASPMRTSPAYLRHSRKRSSGGERASASASPSRHGNIHDFNKVDGLSEIIRDVENPTPREFSFPQSSTQNWISKCVRS